MPGRKEELGRGLLLLAMTFTILSCFAALASARPDIPSLEILHVDSTEFPALHLIVSGGWTGPKLRGIRPDNWSCVDEGVKARVQRVLRFESGPVREQGKAGGRTINPRHLLILSNAGDPDDSPLRWIADCLVGRGEESQRGFWREFVRGLAVEIWAPDCHPDRPPEEAKYFASWLSSDLEDRVTHLFEVRGESESNTYGRIERALRTLSADGEQSQDALLVVLDEKDLEDRDAHRIDATTLLNRGKVWVREALDKGCSLSFLMYGLDEDSEHHRRVFGAIESLAARTGGICTGAEEASAFSTAQVDEEEASRAFRVIAEHLLEQSHERIVEIEVRTPNLDPSRLHRGLDLTVQTGVGSLSLTRSRAYDLEEQTLLAQIERDLDGFAGSLERLLDSTDRNLVSRIRSARDRLAGIGADTVRARWDAVLLERIRGLDTSESSEYGLLADQLFGEKAIREAKLIRELASIERELDAGDSRAAVDATDALLRDFGDDERVRTLGRRVYRSRLDELIARPARRWKEESTFLRHVLDSGLLERDEIEKRWRASIDAFLETVPDRSLASIDALEDRLHALVEDAPEAIRDHADRMLDTAREESFADALESKDPERLIPNLVLFGTNPSPPTIQDHSHPIREAFQVLVELGDTRLPDLVTRLAEAAAPATCELPPALARGLLETWISILETSPRRGIDLANEFLVRPAVPLEIRRRMWSDALERAVEVRHRPLLLAGRGDELVEESDEEGRTWAAATVDRFRPTGDSRLCLEVFLAVLDRLGKALPDRGVDDRIEVLRQTTRLGNERRDMVWRCWMRLESSGRARVARDAPSLRAVADAALAGYHLRELEELLDSHAELLRDQALRYRRTTAMLRMHLATCRLIALGWEVGALDAADEDVFETALKATNRNHWRFECITPERGRPEDRAFLRWDDTEPEAVELVFPLEEEEEAGRLAFGFRVDPEGALEKDHAQNLRRQWRLGVPRILALIAARANPAERQALMDRAWAAVSEGPGLGGESRVEFVLVHPSGQSEPTVHPRSSEKALRAAGLLDIDRLSGDRLYRWEGILEVYPERLPGADGILVVAVRWASGSN